MGCQVLVTEAKPGIALQARERVHNMPALALQPPALGRVGVTRKCVEKRVDIRTDMQAEMLEIIAGIYHHMQVTRR